MRQICAITFPPLSYDIREFVLNSFPHYILDLSVFTPNYIYAFKSCLLASEFSLTDARTGLLEHHIPKLYILDDWRNLRIQ